MMYCLAGESEWEETIKRSRFVARAAPIQSPEDAIGYIDRVRDMQATHNCWAYRVGAAYRFSDDGEPGGTAGRPILSAIDGQQFDCVVVLVTRFFGGIKLGAGGLVRAYSGAAAQCLRNGRRVELRSRIRMQLWVPFDSIGAAYPTLDRSEARRLAEQYDSAGLTIDVEVDEAESDRLRKSMLDATRGRVRFLSQEGGSRG